MEDENLSEENAGEPSPAPARAPIVKFSVGALIAAMVVSVGWIVIEAVLAHPTDLSGDVVPDQILASDVSLVILRIAIVFAAFFVAASVVVRMYQRQWIVKIGNVEVSESS